jgi:polar amino acid transport system substrate-binding protein
MTSKTENHEVDFSIGGITITSERIKRGIKFSQNTLDTGVTLLLQSIDVILFIKLGKTDPWMFVKVFELETGIAIVASTLIVGLLLYFYEGRKQSFFYYMWHSWYAFKFYNLYSFRAQVFFINDIRIETTVGRVVQAIFWFTILILVSTYTANMASMMTQQQMFRYINHLNQIAGQRIASPSSYEDIIKSYGVSQL